MNTQRGAGLAEHLVALAIFALATVVALAQLGSARRAFELGADRTELQQVLRVASDQLLRDLRRAGLNTNPDGDPNRPDEAIEAAGATFVVIRGDADGDLEDALAGGAFQNVSTGNDEIVGYALALPGAVGPDTLQFDADVGEVPRDGVMETVLVERVALTHDDPPYTLYRFHVKPGSNLVLRSPVIDNVRSLRFTYFDGSGNVVCNPCGADGPAVRASIRRIRVEIEGLTRDPDPRWTDPHDSNPATRGHRKFRLTLDITPPNLGLAVAAEL
jgi:hypothetical protein